MSTPKWVVIACSKKNMDKLMKEYLKENKTSLKKEMRLLAELFQTKRKKK